MALTKTDIVEAVQQQLGYTKNRSSDIVEGLLEIIKGGLISSTITVDDMMFESQTVTTKVNGWLGGAVLDSSATSEEKSNLPDAKPVDQIVTAKASLEISIAAWENLQDYVE